MNLFKKLGSAYLLLIIGISLKAQPFDSAMVKTNTNNVIIAGEQTPEKKWTFSKSLIAPALMIAYGVITLRSDPLQDAGEEMQKKIWVDNPHNKSIIDNYLQFAPAVAVYGLNLVGIKGKNNFRDRSIMYFMSNIFMNVTVTSVKKFTHEQRPDGSDYLSFPSGHTAEAFASAEFLRQEYKDVSPWYGIAGYITAGATGFMRMYNNKHWFGDIVAGAGVGIASTKLAYWIYPAISRKLFHKKYPYTTLMPYYQNKEAGLSMLYVFH